VDDVEAGLTEVRRQLQELATGEPPVGFGEAAEGMVRVTAVDGRVSRVDLNPRVMRMASEELAEYFAEAVNAALADLAAKVPQAALPNIDLTRLDAQLAEAEQQAAVSIRRYEQSIAEALRQGGL
jgi:DNA-binding protein YbaB